MWSVAKRFAQHRDAGTGPRRLRFPLPDLVLPQMLRRPARMLSKVDIPLSDRFGVKASAALLITTALYGVLVGNHAGDLFGSLTAAAGLKVDAIRITGQIETAELDVLERLALPENGSIVTFDANAARQRVENIPWVESATVRKIYPGTVEVQIVEREPFALWQRNGQVVLIDADGIVLTDQVGGRYAGLPLVVGAGARSQAAEIVDLIEQFPTLTPEIRGATLVSDRRWDLLLKNGIVIQLPEDAPLAALIQLVSIDQQSGLLSRPIARVDLRLSDRLVVEMTDAGMAEIGTMVNNRTAAARRVGA